MIPDPTNTSTSLFPCAPLGHCLDDTVAQVNFSQGFTFPFFGTTYTSVWINTNGGVTFGAGDSNPDPGATNIADPGIAILWGDMFPGAQGISTLPDEIDYQQFSDHFVISYTNLEDYNDYGSILGIENTATLTLYNDGRVVMSYANQQTSSTNGSGILVGVFDGSESGYLFPSSVLTTYSGYSSGSGVIVFNDNGSGGMLSTTGELNNTTITFTP